MLKTVIIFFVIALIAGVLGFTGIAAAAAAGIAKIVFWIAIVLFGISLIANLIKKV